MKNVVIFYHKDCLDGFGGAWAAWKKFGSRADYIALENGEKPVFARNKEVYLVDFCHDREIMEKLLKNNKKVVVIDHHKSRKQEAKISSECVFSLNNSASVLAWKYFHPKKPLPKLLLYVEQGDLWRFKSAFTRELLQGLKIKDKDFKLWNKIAADFEKAKTREKYLREGRAIVESNEKRMETIMENAEEVLFEGRRAIAVNSSVLASELGNLMCRKMKYPVGIVWLYEKGRIRVHLRAWNKVDVSKIAKKYGGGGHKNASGFNVPAKFKFPWKRRASR